MKEPDKAADSVFSFEKCHFNFILDSRTKEDCFYFLLIHHQTLWLGSLQSGSKSVIYERRLISQLSAYLLQLPNPHPSGRSFIYLFLKDLASHGAPPSKTISMHSLKKHRSK